MTNKFSLGEQPAMEPDHVERGRAVGIPDGRERPLFDRTVYGTEIDAVSLLLLSFDSAMRLTSSTHACTV